MKTLNKAITFSLIAFFLLGATMLKAQISGNGQVSILEYDLNNFNQIEVSGAFEVELSQSDEYFVRIETDENLFPNIEVKVRNEKLELGSKNIRKYSIMKAIIGMPELNGFEASGAVFLSSDNILAGESLILSLSGASKANLVLDYNFIETTLSGACKLTLEGQAESHSAKISGASKLHAGQLQTTSTVLHASGASKAHLWAQDHLETNTSGAATVSLDNTPEVWFSNGKQMSGQSDKKVVQTGRNKGDTTRVNIGDLNIEVIEDENVTVNIAGRKIVVDEDGNVDIKKKGKEKKRKFNGHWAGLELGFNGLLTPDFFMSYPKEDSYLDLRMEKSINVNLNFFEQNIPLNKARNVGLVSGLGLSWNNYRFGNNVYITPDSATLKGYLMDGVSVRKSKLTNLYLTVPLLFEVQSKGNKTMEKLHFAAGVIGGWRIRTHTKIYYNEPNKEFRLRDPETGTLLPIVQRSPDASNRAIVKKYDSFHMAPLKLDATVRAGWGIVNLYANYSITSLFIEDKGPELYPFSIGLLVTGW
jgi:hypothetical protein